MKRVLVVDDEPTILKGARMLLELEGFEVITAEDGRKALALLNGKGADEMPDLVLTDRMMPELNGVSLCRRLREDPSFDGVPIVMMSAGPEPVEHRGLYDVFVRKPFQIDELLKLIGALRDHRPKNEYPTDE